VTTAPVPDPGRTPRLETDAASRVADLFERHGRMVYALCRAMLRDVDEAEDAAQQTFLLAHRALRGGVHVRDGPAWLAAIARNECRARIVAHMREPLPLADEDLDALASPVDDVERRLQAEALQRALGALPERQREAVVLRYLYGLRYGEVATALGLSRPATEALLFRARRAMRGSLRPVAGAALVVPLAMREELALAIPGFATAGGSSAAAAGVAGGLLAKLTAGPVGAKAVTAVVAVSTVGTIGVADSERAGRDPADRVPFATSVSTVPDDPGGLSRVPGGSGSEDDDRRSSGPGGGDDDDLRAEVSGDDDRSGRGSGDRDDDADRGDDGDSSGPGSRGRGEPTVDNDSADSPSSGPGSGDEDDPEDGGDSGSDGSSGSSGPGSGADNTDDPDDPADDSSGSESSGSPGSSGSDSGSGSGGDPDP